MNEQKMISREVQRAMDKAFSPYIIYIPRAKTSKKNRKILSNPGLEMLNKCLEGYGLLSTKYE